MNEYGMHIVINYFLSHNMSQQCNENYKKKNKTLAYHWDYLPTRRVMWSRQGECGNFTIRQVETGQACLHTVCNTNSFIKKITHRKQNMLYLADMWSRLTCSNYFLNLTVVSFLSIKLKKKKACKEFIAWWNHFKLYACIIYYIYTDLQLR